MTPRRGQSLSGGHGMALGELSPGNPKANIVPSARRGIYSSALVTLGTAGPMSQLRSPGLGWHLHMTWWPSILWVLMLGSSAQHRMARPHCPHPCAHSGGGSHTGGHGHGGDHEHGGDHGHRGDQEHGGDHRHREDQGHSGDQGHRGDQGHGDDRRHGGDQGHRSDQGHGGGRAGAAEAVAELFCPRGLPVSQAAAPGPAALAGGPAAGTAPSPADPGPAPPRHPAGKDGAGTVPAPCRPQVPPGVLPPG